MKRATSPWMPMPDLDALLAHWGYAAIFAVVVLGNVGLPVPEESVLVLAGYAAWRGGLSLGAVLAVGVAGAVAGDNLGYWLGRRYGPAVLERYGRWARVNPERLRAVNGLVARYGAWTVFVARFVAGLRFLAGPLAGAAGVRPTAFLVANALGALLFVPYAAILGYAMGHGFGSYVEWIHESTSGVLGYGLLAAAVVGLYRFSRRASARPAPRTSRPLPEAAGARHEPEGLERVGRADWRLTVWQAIPQVFTLVQRLRPTMHLPSVRAIDDVVLETWGIRAVVWDVDGTLLEPGAAEVVADHREHVQQLFRSSRLRHAIVSNCGEARYGLLGRLFPRVPIVAAYRTPEGPLYRVIHEGRERWTPHSPGRDASALRPLRKPNAEVLRFIATFLTCPLETVVMVGDQYFTDIAGANLAGIRSIKVPTVGRAQFPFVVRWFQRLETALSVILFARGRR
jgi:HAD superfamily phosphatase (TIGR01668 family)